MLLLMYVDAATFTLLLKSKEMLDSTVTAVVKFFTRLSGVLAGFTVDIFSASISLRLILSANKYESHLRIQQHD
jgi:hypothetical protein